MHRYRGRLKAIERKMPRGFIGDAELWLEFDGMLHNGDEVLTQEQFNERFANEEVIHLGPPEDEE